MTDYLLQQVVNALSAGSLYALMAVGLALVFGILRLINFAHGDVMMVAAYIAVFSLASGMPLPVAIITMILGTAVVGLLIERVAYRPLRGAPEVALLLTSFAVGQILQNSVLLLTRLAGKPIQVAFPAPEVLSGVVNVGSLTISKVNLGSFIVGVVVLVLLTMFVSRTRLGTVHARLRGRPRCRKADGHPNQSRGRRGLRDRGRHWRRSRGSSTPRRRARSTRTWASPRS